MRHRRLSPILGAEALVIIVGAVYALILVVFLSAQVAQDTWLALVGGRAVAQDGLPAHDILTAWTRGDRWIDQQWLGQIVFYGLERLAGLKLVLLAHAALAGSAFGLALAFARRRGGSQRMVARFGILALGSLVIVSTAVRTQSFGYLLFVAVLWLACTDSARPSLRVLWIAPLLALWTNIHGSVLLGAALVALAGTVFLLRGLRGDGAQRREQLRHGALLLAIGVISPLISPYAPDLGSYYASTLFNGEFDKLITEWMSPSPSIPTAAFYVLGGLTLWLIGRSGAQLTGFERIVLVVTLLAGLLAIRNMVWFALAATMLVPVLAERAGTVAETRQAPEWFEATLSCVAIGAVVLAVIATAAGSASGYEQKYPPRAADAVWQAAQRDPTSMIFADEAYGDWLLWRHPSLAGRILFDARFELLSTRELRDVVRFYQQVGPRWRDALGGARILIMRDRKPLPDQPSSMEVLQREGRFRAIAKVDDVAVLTRTP